MTYFSELPTIFYDFNINGVNEIKILRDISVNLRFRSQYLSDITMYEEYDILDGETPDIISEKIYGTPYYHWIILVLNERLDYANDWPLTTNQLQMLLTDRYGEGNEYATHHYINSAGRETTLIEPYIDFYREPLSVICNTSAGSNIITAVTANNFETLNDGSDYYVAGIGMPPFQSVSVNSFTSNSECVLDTAAIETSTQYGSALSFTRVIVPSYTAVTNYAYESELNEAKRRIKLLHPSVINSVAAQMKALVNE